MSPFLLLLLPVAALCGWSAAKRQHNDVAIPDEKQFARDYLVGLNYLLNEQPDKAVDVFIKMLEVDSETVETHLTLGTLFRRRGEVGRAIRIHQNLIARPQLTKSQRADALTALGLDYLRAGMLDRAERVFLETINKPDGEDNLFALRHLLDIYQQQKQWVSAIQIAEKLFSRGEAVRNQIAQYYCELAVLELKREKRVEAQVCVKQALASDPSCVRASLLQGDIEIKAGEFKAAIEVYQRVQEQDAAYLSETVKPLVSCYEKLGEKNQLKEFLQQSLAIKPRTSILLALVELIKEQEGDEAAAACLSHELRRCPSLKGLQRLLALQLNNAANVANENLLALQDLILNLLKNKAAYRCISCGFGSKVLDWFCPSCKGWSTVKPVLGVEGE